MPTERPFVGRERELAELQQAIAREDGQLLLTVGGPGFGKTALLEELNRRLARTAGDQAWFSLLFRLNRNDKSEAFLPRLAQDLLQIEDLTRGRLVLGAPGRREQWRALLGSAPAIGKLLESFVSDDRRFPREIFLDFLAAVAKCLEGEQRLVLTLDPDECLDESVEADWASVVRGLPDRVSIVFAQRADDCLARSEACLRAPNCHRVPERPLGHLTRGDNDELVVRYWQARGDWVALSGAPPKGLMDILWDKYQGYALALTMALDDLPKSPLSLQQLLAVARNLPAPYASLLRRRYDDAVAVGENAARLLHALAMLGVATSCSRLAGMYADQGVTADAMRSLSTQGPVARCLDPTQETDLTLLHSTMGECITQALAEDEKRGLHRRAASLYAADLSKNQSDPAALDLLPYHLHEAGDEEAFLEAVDRVGPEKYRLRLLRSSLRDLREALAIYRRVAQQEPAAFEPDVPRTLTNLGILLTDLGDRAGAKEADDEAVAIYRRLARQEPAAFEPDVAMALNNLGSALRHLGHPVGAKQGAEEALAIYRRLAQAEPAAFLERLAGTVRNAVRLLQEGGDDLFSWPSLAAALELFARVRGNGEE